MKDRKHLSRARALTRDLERAMDKFEPALASTTSQAMPVAGILGPAFEYDRARRSTAPSPEMMPTPNLNQDKGDLEYSKSGRSIRWALWIVPQCMFFDCSS